MPPARHVSRDREGLTVARVLRMPDVASDEDVGVLAAWLVEESATFDAAQTIAYVETESMLLSVEAGRPGVLVKVLVEPGAAVDPGTPIGVLADPEEQVDDVGALLVELGIAPDQVVPVEGPVDPVPGLYDAQPLFEPHLLGGVEVLAPPLSPVGSPLDAAPAAAPLRRADLADLDPLGTVAEEDEDTVPHLVLRTTVRAEPLLRLHDDVAGGPTPATLGDLVVKTVAATFELVPEFDATPGARPGFVDVALALPGPDGTVTPVVRDAGSLSLGRLAATTHDLVSRAADGRLDPTEVDGGAIEVTDLAAYGVAELVASVTPPRLAHLAFGTVRDEPVVQDGELVPGQVVTVTLSVDHERVDRLVAARWLAAFVDLLGRPARALV
jgi:pyruvate dehydrogenase E2 component (dihydrolipoamide acetyltransferase)